jgi:ubiquinone/menaquinone biosynthesis C-methylase UbiE
MQKARSDIEQFYLSGEYLRKNPSLHVEDSGWKAEVIAPFVDRFALIHSGSPLKVLDVGGGAGVLLSMIADRLRRTAGRPVTKCAIEFSPEMLEVQKSNNPDLERTEQGSIEATSFGDKEFDLVLLIDVLEHLPNAETALREIRRIGRYAIIKIPLEDTVHFRLMNALRGGSLRRHAIESVGHVQSFSVATYRQTIHSVDGTILEERFTNIFGYLLASPSHRSKMSTWQRCRNLVCSGASSVAPRLTARFFRDHVVMLVRFPKM